MYIPIVYPSAAEFWLNSANLTYTDHLDPVRRTIVNLPEQYSLCSNKENLLKIKNQLALSLPVTIMAPCGSARRNNQFSQCVIRPDSLPMSGFVNAGRIDVISGTGRKQNCRILVASPELCFLQAARHMTTVELIKFGYDLCAMFIYDETAEYQQMNRNMITSTKDIKAFLDGVFNFHGIVKARQAIQYVYDRSNSPKETMLSMVAGMPFLKGGFRLEEQELNKRIILSKEGASILGRNSCICDIVWDAQKLVVEYDSNLVHLKPEQHDRDKRKTAALIASGYRVFPITSKMVSNIDEVEKTFLTLRKMLGKRTCQKDIIRTREHRIKLFHFLNRAAWFC